MATFETQQDALRSLLDTWKAVDTELYWGIINSPERAEGSICLIDWSFNMSDGVVSFPLGNISWHISYYDEPGLFIRTNARLEALLKAFQDTPYEVRAASSDALDISDVRRWLGWMITIRK